MYLTLNDFVQLCTLIVAIIGLTIGIVKKR